MYTPSEAEIVKVMKETGMDYMQAVYHLRGRHHLQSDTIRRTFPPFSVRAATVLRYTLRLRTDGAHLCALDPEQARSMVEPCAGTPSAVYVETIGGAPRVVLAFDTEGRPLIRGSNGTICRYV